MKRIKLNPRAFDLLILIADYSGSEADGPAWVPGPQAGLGQDCPSLGRSIEVSGAADANALRGLESKCLIVPVPDLGSYAYRVSEQGRIYVERLRESGEIEQA